MIKSLLKTLYKKMPFKQPVFSLVRNTITLPNRIYKHLYFDGVVSFKVNGRKIRMNQKGYDIENTLFWAGVEGCWEKVSMGIWMKLCAEATVILDIGANTGAYSLIAKTINQKARVIAVEPLDFIFNKLVANVQLNNLDIECIPVALSDYDGKGEVFMESDDHVYAVTVNKNLTGNNSSIIRKEIDTKKLSSIIKELDIPHIDIMKLDVETHEPEALTGMGEYLMKWKPVLLIEILNDDVAKKVETIVHGLDYLFYNIDEDGGIRKVSELTKSDYYNYLFCSAKKAAFLKLPL